jgi:hypothetical protein
VLETHYGVGPASNQTLLDWPELGDKLPFGQSLKMRSPRSYNASPSVSRQDHNETLNKES